MSMRSWRVSFKWVSWVAFGMLTSVGCTRGKVHPPEQQVKTPALQPIAPAGVDDDWTQGRLPASVTQGTPAKGGRLTVGISADPPSLNILVDPEQFSAWITQQHVYEGLVGLDQLDDPGYRIAPALAERWEISADQRVYTFHLRQGVTWHDGHAFSAADVIATFDKVFDPTTKAAHVRSNLAELASYKALDDHTVVLTWKHPYFLALDNLADVIIQPAHIIAKLKGSQYNDAASNPINRHPIGTGPFKFAEWESGVKISIERNDAYWGPKPYLDRVVFRVVTDRAIQLQLAERGEIDIAYQLTYEQWARMDSPTLRSNWNRSKLYPAAYQWIGWNEARPYFSDKTVRRALTMLVDRPGMTDKLFYGLPRPTTCHFYWASPACDPNLKPLPYDPAAALKLLDDAGWKDTNGDGIRDKNGVPFHFVFMIPVGSSDGAKVAAKLKEDFARAGIELDIQAVEWAAFTRRLTEHNFDACMLLWGGGPRGEPSQVWHSNAIKGGSNYISYRNAEVDKIIEQARITLDADARNAMYRRFDAILQEDQPYTFMFVRPMLELLSKKVKGAKPNLLWWNYETMWIDPNWQPAK